jgi:hypothetical protein
MTMWGGKNVISLNPSLGRRENVFLPFVKGESKWDYILLPSSKYLLKARQASSSQSQGDELNHRPIGSIELNACFTYTLIGKYYQNLVIRF